MTTIRASADNRIVTLGEACPRKKLMPFFSYSHPGYQYLRHQPKYRHWDGRVKFMNANNELPAGLFWATRKEIENALGIKFKVRARTRGVVPRKGIRSDRAYQNDCVDRMLASIRHGGGLVLNATGTGKTRIAGLFASRVNTELCFIVDQLDLLEQAVEELENVLGEKVGYVGNSVYDPQRVTVATVQTINRHIKDKKFRKWFKRIELLIIDEIHVQMSKRNFDTVLKIQPKAVFGLTATLQLKKKPIRVRAWSICGPVLFDYSLAQGMKENILSKGVIVRVQFNNRIDLDG